MKTDVVIKILGVIFGIIAGAFGGFDGIFIALLCAIVIDISLGISLGFVGKSPNTKSGGIKSKYLWLGLTKKLATLLMIFFCNILDQYVLVGKPIMRDAAIMLYIATEGLSIIENISLLGIPIPKKLQKVLEQLKEKEEQPKKDKKEK